MYDVKPTGLGGFVFSGPGLGQYCNDLRFDNCCSPEFYTDRVQRMLAKAFEAGRQTAKLEIRSVLGCSVPR